MRVRSYSIEAAQVKLNKELDQLIVKLMNSQMLLEYLKEALSDVPREFRREAQHVFDELEEAIDEERYEVEATLEEMKFVRRHQRDGFESVNLF